MARIVVSASCAWGHLLPMLALGAELSKRGHAVRVAAPAHRHPLVRSAGFEPLACGAGVSAADANRWTERQGARPFNQAEANQAVALLMDTPGQFRDLAGACEGAELLVSHASQYAAALVHRRLRLPWVCVSTVPGQFRHFEYAACAEPAPPADLNLLASSMLFSSPDLGYEDSLHVTGFLFFDGSRMPAWRPPPNVKSFVEDGARVLVLTMGSLPGREASAAAVTLARAAERLGRKLVIQPGGWEEMDERGLQGPRDAGLLCLAGPLDHDWLLARADAAIHFGGAGICARTLRNGVPSLVLPQRADQVFNARCLLELGVGAAMAASGLTEEGVRRILLEKVLAPEYRAHAEAAARELAQEDGAATACRRIERLLEAR
ncbi:MAG: hypothetical protein KIS92_23165 [Planctomycetota bacterium]|nr:hypothetical protein [Planctomycetota bacterium]